MSRNMNLRYDGCQPLATLCISDEIENSMIQFDGNDSMNQSHGNESSDRPAIIKPIVNFNLQEDFNATPETCGADHDLCITDVLNPSPPTKPTLNSIDDNIVDFEARTDTEVRDEEFVERDCPPQSPNHNCPPQSPTTSYNFHIEVDEDGSNQIEVLTQSLSEEFGCWGQNSISIHEPSPIKNRERQLFHTSPDKKDNIINSLLEKNRFMCSGLENWYSVDESDHEIIVTDEPEMPRNRAGFPEGRKKRIEHLKINLTPFELDEAAIVKGSINSKKYDPVKFEKRNYSFSSFNTPSPTSVASMGSPSNRFDCYNYELPTCGNTNATNVDKLALVDWDDIEEDLCYDSDPNELLVSSPMIEAKKDCRRRKQKDRTEMKTKTVSQLMGTKLLLVWHRPFESSSVAVHTWIEHGSYIHAGLIQPKLMWQESCGKERKDSERFILNKMSFHSIDLLDISKVIPLNSVDRELYPFAKKSHCLMIQAYDKEMIFEAESANERDIFIEGLKILVARLGSKIIVGDKDVLEEFFTPASSSVPGQVPDILIEGPVDVIS